MDINIKRGENMKIDVWSDFACPFCYIGKRNMEDALKEYDGEVEIEFHSFQLDPNAKKSHSNPSESLGKKYGMPAEEAQKMIDRVVNMAKDVGLDYNYDALIENNTMKAHKLLQYSKEENKDKIIKEQVFKAHFIDGKDIGDDQVLIDIGLEAGLEEGKIIEALDSEKYQSMVEADRYTASQLEISSVPFFIIDNKRAIQGAQPKEAFLKVFTQNSI